MWWFSCCTEQPASIAQAHLRSWSGWFIVVYGCNQKDRGWRDNIHIQKAYFYRIVHALGFFHPDTLQNIPGQVSGMQSDENLLTTKSRAGAWSDEGIFRKNDYTEILLEKLIMNPPSSPFIAPTWCPVYIRLPWLGSKPVGALEGKMKNAVGVA